MTLGTIVKQLIAVVAVFGSVVLAQQAADISEFKLLDWQPRSMLKSEQSVVEAPAAPDS